MPSMPISKKTISVESPPSSTTRVPIHGEFLLKIGMCGILPIYINSKNKFFFNSCAHYCFINCNGRKFLWIVILIKKLSLILMGLSCRYSLFEKIPKDFSIFKTAWFLLIWVNPSPENRGGKRSARNLVSMKF